MGLASPKKRKPELSLSLSFSFHFPSFPCEDEASKRTLGVKVFLQNTEK